MTTRPDVFGINPLGHRREANQIDEQDRDNLPLLLQRRTSGQRGSARKAEAGALRILLSAIDAGRYGESVRRSQSLPNDRPRTNLPDVSDAVGSLRRRDATIYAH